MSDDNLLKWYQKPKGVILLLVFFFPLGLYFMWKNEMWSKKTRLIITSILIIAIIFQNGNNKSQFCITGETGTIVEIQSMSFDESFKGDISILIANSAISLYYSGQYTFLSEAGKKKIIAKVKSNLSGSHILVFEIQPSGLLVRNGGGVLTEGEFYGDCN